MRPTEIDPIQYSAQLTEKRDRITQQFDGFGMPELQVFESAPLHYRMRAEFRVWHDGDDLFHIMFDQNSKEKYRVDSFPVACTLINQMMEEMMTHLRPNEVLRRKLFQIDYLATQSGEILVSLLYHKPLDSAWQSEAETLLSQLQKDYKVSIIGRARKQKIVLGEDFVTEVLNINGRDYRFKQIENSFTQPNAGVNEQMIQWALEAAGDPDTDLLELYCGLGNFTLPLAQNFRRVLGTEISKSSVYAAQYNITLNQIDNVEVARISSEGFSDPTSGERAKLVRKGLDLEAYDFSTVLVDPPRAGLDPDTLAMISAYEGILYISCNPDTLADNLTYLNETHEVKAFALFDQFPYTHHAECGIYLSKRG